MRRLLSLGLIVWASTGCSVVDDSVRVVRCDVDADCARFQTDDPACLTFRCVSTRCVPAVRDDDGDGAGPETCVDRYCTDSEGACAARDCDDANASVRPGAAEVCNGIDDDCDGRLDGPDEDDDGDGHADRCAGAAARDCDDEDPDTWVGAPERCDGLDNDCMQGGLVRPTGGPAPEPSEDADGDGRADPRAACEGGPFPQDDCDDAREDVYAGAIERCDGLDNDCNGVPDDRRAGEPGSSCVPVDITAGDAHSCIRTADGEVVCWGASDFRLAASNLSETFAVVAGTERFVGGPGHLDVAAGQDGTCAIVGDGSVRCWGSPSLVSPELPLQPLESHRLARIVGVRGATAVAAGQDHACALVPEGVMCWGRNENGAVDGAPGNAEPVPAYLVPGTAGATHVDTSFTHSCAVVGGRVGCWGDPAAGALGGTPDPTERTAEVPGITDAVEVAVGRCFTCVRRADGSVWCLGDPRYEDDARVDGPCEGPATPAPRPVAVSGAVSIDAYAVHACAALETGEVRCWGNNVTRQLGEGTPFDDAHPREGYDRPEAAPATVIGIDDATRVVTGTWHSCALRPDGAMCWGRQARHRLGDGRPGDDLLEEPRPYALPVSVIRGPAQLAAGARGTCFRMPDLSLRCSGVPHAGSTGSCYGSRYAAEGWGTVLDVRMSGHALCAITGRLAPGAGVVDRVVRCAGSRLQQPFLQAADGDGAVRLGVEPIQLAVGGRHACALGAEGSVHCWGVHDLGQLGAEDPVDDLCEVPTGQNICSLRPIPVALPGPAIATAAGSDHTCALLAEGRVACWGDNDFGQLGRSPLTSVGAVGLVEGLPPADPATGIAAAGNTTCAILTSGQTWCWGASPVDDEGGPWPRHIAELGSAQQLGMYVGAGRTLGICARLSVGVVRCVGRNPSGQVGGLAPVCAGTLPARCPVETSVSRFDDVRDLACGDGHCCATRGSGQVVCWGDRTDGACGDGVAAPDMYGTASTVGLITWAAGEAPACVGP